MKKWYFNIALVSLVLFMGFSFTSCEMDPDDNIGYDLRGHWFGDLDMYYDGIPARGSDIIFYPEGYGYHRGTGTQIDYYGRYGRERIIHDFSYQINRGVIYLTFYDEPELDCTISDYGLNAYKFWGRIDGRYSSTNFSLRNYDSDWDRYGYDGYDYDYDRRYYGGYYTKQEIDLEDLSTRTAEPDSTLSKPKATRGVNQAS